MLSTHIFEPNAVLVKGLVAAGACDGPPPGLDATQAVEPLEGIYEKTQGSRDKRHIFDDAAN